MFGNNQEADIIFIKDNIKKDQKLMALDVSKNNIGIAISDTNLQIAFPLSTIIRTKLHQDAQILKKLIIKENIFAIIVGLPLNGDGALNERTQSIRDFAIKFKEFFNIPIFFQDERFSTYFTKRDLFNKKAKNIDAKAASWFLQIFLDKIKNH